MWLIKALGCALVILCGGGAGISLAGRLKRRVNTLIETEFAIDKVAVYIAMSNCDIGYILDLSMPKGMSFDGEGLIADNRLCLNGDDRALITAFLKDLGMSDTSSQLKRCAAFKELIKEQRRQGQRDVDERYRLFLICGWLTGIILSLLWW